MKQPSLSRRDFLKVSGSAAGGLMLGVSIPALTRASEDESGFVPNAFVHIDPNGDTTLYCGRCEMGQGISTALPAAVADELEADWSRVHVLQGDADKKFGPQSTGGSNSINTMFLPMRQAGAAAKLMLIAAAARRWGIPASSCYAELHEIRNRKDDRRLGYGELAAAAARMEVPQDPRLKSRDQFRYIGKPLPRHDQDQVVVGKRIYGIDARLPGMKFAAVRHAPVYGAQVKRFDKQAALAMPGVVDVIHIERFDRAYGSLGGIAVVADNTWTAQQALKKVDIEWDRGQNTDYDTTRYKQALVKQVESPAERVFERGDVEAAFDSANQVHEATYQGGHLSHSPMEPVASLAWVQDNRCEIWAATQDPVGIQNTVGDFLGRRPGEITVHVNAAGGAFGRKSKCDYVQEAAALSQAVGLPVLLAWSREEDTRTGYYHSVNAQHIKASLDEGGHVTGWLHRAAFPPIASTFNPEVDRPSTGDLRQVSDHPYGIASLRVESGLAPAHTRIGWFRSVYALFYGFAINVFTDELAHSANMDPLAFFRQIYSDSSDPEQAEAVRRSQGVLDLVAEKSGWGKPLPKGQGRGLAVHHSFRSYVATVVHAEVQGEDIRVHRVDCAVDCGLVLNPDGATAQMEGAVVMGMTAALHTEITFRDGAVVNSNFHDYPILRTQEVPPEIHVHFVASDAPPTGLGEPGVPTVAPALVNALFAASGQRYRSIPIKPLKV